MLAGLQQPGDLHGERRTAGDDVATGRELNRRASERQRIDAVMAAEPLVFVGKKQRKETRIDILLGRREPPASIAGRIGAQQTPFTVEDDVRIFEILAKWRRPERIGPDAENEQSGGKSAHT